MADQDFLNFIIKLRCSVGCIGEQSENKWWKGGFYSPSSSAFLKPIFNKTSHVAIYQGVKAEASIIHDEYIGAGAGVYHLFRLPETLEIDLLNVVRENPNIVITNLETSKDFLSSITEGSVDRKEGPIFIDKINEISKLDKWKLVASYYSNAFDNNIQSFPFFARSDS